MLRSLAARRRVASSSYSVELIGAADLARVRGDWADLFDRCLECNVFFGPDLLEPLATGPLCDKSFRVLLAWRQAPGARTLAGFMPLHLSAGPLAPVRGFKHHYVVGSTPLIDSFQPEEAANALLHGLTEIRPGALLILDDVRLDWPAWQSFVQAAQASGCVFEEQDVTVRAGVSPASGTTHMKGKIAQNLRRCGAKLSALGAWSVSTPMDIDAAREAFEALLSIEASGWKGAAGTALASNADTLAFARTAFDPANLRPSPVFSVLWLEERAVAVSMNLVGHDNAANLKCAYDETYAAFSPGVLLDVALADELRRTSFTPMIDSVAMPGHPVERVWPERLRRGWIAMACDPATGLAEFHARLGIEQMRRTMRRMAVNAYNSTIPVLRKAVGRN
ncbi:MAG: GNAT family N-acetyltransferase [Beijerinckiaceae bacterium]|nr:GNAT family N-acetyltransferase [Beijerinckiaceae bacterium]